jgi:hypothetical protein
MTNRLVELVHALQDAAIAGSEFQRTLPKQRKRVEDAGPKDGPNWRPDGPTALDHANWIRATHTARCNCDAVTDALANCAGDVDRLVPRERGTALSVELGARAKTLHRAFTTLLDWLEADAPYPIEAARDLDAGDALGRASDLIARAMRTTPNTSASNQAFGAAIAFVENLAMVAQRAREYQPSDNTPDEWHSAAFHFAQAFIAWHDLTHLLTPAVRTDARRLYHAGAAPVRLCPNNSPAPVVPTMPASVTRAAIPYRRIELGATPFPTVIEAIADELGLYLRNAVYADRWHPLEPDLDNLMDEAKATATARQVAQGKPAEPMGWGEDLHRLLAQADNTPAWSRLMLTKYGEVVDRMMREWCGQNRATGESALDRLRCDPINFADLRLQLVREAEAVGAAASKPNGTPMDPARIERLEAVVAAAMPAAEPSGPKPTRAKKAKVKAQTKADQVRAILGMDPPFEGTKAQLASRVGYRQQSCLTGIKNFDTLWEEHSKRVEARKRHSAGRMQRAGE